MALPLIAAKNFVLLAQQYRDLPIEFPHLKGVTLAQWAMESGWGKTKLAGEFGNYAGMKWGACDAGFGSPVVYGKEKYTWFSDLTSFIHAYWNRLDSVDLYGGWREHAETPETFINFITPPWLTGRRTTDGALTQPERTYVRDITDIRVRRTEEFFSLATKEIA